MKATTTVLDQDVVDVADRWWARGFGREPSDLRPLRTHVQQHAGTEVDTTGIWILAVGPAPLVSLPGNAMERLATRATTWTRSLVSDVTKLGREVRLLEGEGIRIGSIVGPAFIGYGGTRTMSLTMNPAVRALTTSDDDAVVNLRQSCSEEEWAHGGSDHNAVPSFGYFDDHGNLLALAGYKTWGEDIAHLSIVSATSARSHGYASAAVSHAARHALDGGLVPQYRTLVSNKPSIALAEKLGFEPYGFSVYVRLHAGAIQ